ncbi:MAG: flagellar biosynthetic protein FliO [Planctomycetota bacterium]
MNKLSNRFIPIAIALVGVLAAILATPLLFPTNANGGATRPAKIVVSSNEAKTHETISKAATADEEALAKLGIAILGIAATGFASLWIIKHTKTLSFRKRGQKKRLEVIDVLNLGNKKSIAVARIYDRVVVLGIGEGPVSFITELKEEEAGLAPAEIAARELELNHDGRRDAVPAFRGLINNLLQRSKPRAAPSADAGSRPLTNDTDRDVEISAMPRRTQPAPRRTIAELQEMENARLNVTVGASVDEDLL